MIKHLFLSTLIIQMAYSYLDILLNVKRQHQVIQYLLPIKVNQIQYQFGITFENSQQFIAPLSQKLSKNKKHKKHKAKQQDDQQQQLSGVIKASSLQGYSFEGWKRFFMEALLYIQSRYYHQININFDGIQTKSTKISEQTNQTLDGKISFGPDLPNNKIYQLIKSKTQFIKNDIVSIYRGVNDKNVRMQLGGFQQSFARGYRNGILFYELDIKAINNKWRIPIKSVSCLTQRNGRDNIFYITNSQLQLSISIQSPMLILPITFASEVERNFQGSKSTCKITQSSRLACTNMTAIDLSLNFMQFKIDTNAFINISLYDLRDTYDEKTNETVFLIHFSPNPDLFQLGQSFFKSYYVSVDMQNKKMLFSPINRYPTEYYGVYIIRFFIGFGIFTIAAAFIAMIWQNINDPFRKNRLMLEQDGVRLVTYQRTNEIQE